MVNSILHVTMLSKYLGDQNSIVPLELVNVGEFD